MLGELSFAITCSIIISSSPIHWRISSREFFLLLQNPYPETPWGDLKKYSSSLLK
jgi:hypothetical protein